LPNGHPLMLLLADQTRTDFAVIKAEPEEIQA